MRNVGSADKALRIVLGIVIIAVGVFYESWWGLIGVLLLATGLINWCPAYWALRINSLGSKKTQH